MDEKDKTILALKDEGKSLRAIGKVLNLSHVAVSNRLKKATEEKIAEQKRQAQGKYKINDERPELNAAITDIDQLINEVEVLARTELEIDESDDFRFETASGWRIEKIYY